MSELGAEAILEIERLSRAAIEPNLFETNDGKHIRWLRKQDGSVERMPDRVPEPWDVTLLTLDQFIGFVQANLQTINNIFVGPDEIVWYKDTELRLEKAAMPLKLDPRYEKMTQWTNGASGLKDQKDFLRMLLIDLYGCGVSKDFIATVRTLKFQNSSEVGGNIQAGSEQMGKTINAAVAGADKLPETTQLKMKVYEDFEDTETIICAVEPQLDKAKLQLIALPGELVKARNTILSNMADQIKQEIPSARVYLGMIA